MAKVENLIWSAGSFKLIIDKLEFPDTGVTCLWGPSGSGKSTLLKILAGLLPAPGTRFFVQGCDLATLSLKERNTGFVFQDFALFPHMTAWENLSFAAEARDMDARDFEKRADELFSALSLTAIRSTKAQYLSGGESQRVALARALVSRPRIVFLDEPFSQLDAHLRESARALLREMSLQYEIPFLLVSHDERDPKSLADYIFMLNEGKVIESGPVKRVLSQPHTLKAAEMLPDFQILNLRESEGQASSSNPSLLGAEVPAARKIFSERSALASPRWGIQVSAEKSPWSAKVLAREHEGRRQWGYVQLIDGQKLWVDLELEENQSEGWVKFTDSVTTVFSPAYKPI